MTALEHHLFLVGRTNFGDQMLGGFIGYDVIVLGRSVEKLLSADSLRQLEDYVRNHSGTVIFSRGRAFGVNTPNQLEPVIWSDKPTEHVRLQVAREQEEVVRVDQAFFGVRAQEVLRVPNDELVERRAGGDEHPHRPGAAAGASSVDTALSCGRAGAMGARYDWLYEYDALTVPV